jgi:XTP/dITP diphosphohydrolase
MIAHNRPRLVFASLNPGKVREVRDLLAGLDLEVLSAADAGVASLPEETGETFVDNALIKAAHVFLATGLPTVSDDSGLEVFALGGAPGVHSARYAGGGHDHDANIAKLLDALDGFADRSARFVCHAVVVGDPIAWPALAASLPPDVTRLPPGPPLPGGAVAVAASGEVRGTILRERRGTGGFGYDPVFLHEGEGGTFAELEDGRKNALSHRGAAFRLLRPLFRTLAPGSGS